MDSETRSRKMPYSALKILHHPDRVDALRKGEHPVLTRVQVIPTNRCNQHCRFCAYRAPDTMSSETFYEPDEITTPDLLAIIDDCARLRVKAVEITGGGEPTLHPGFGDMCARLRHWNIDYAVVTNGTSDRYRDDLLDAQWVRFSIDASTPETYAEVRHSSPAAFYQVRRRLAELCQSRDGKPLVIGASFVVTADNWQEVYDAARNAKEDGVDNFRIAAMFQYGGAEYFKPFYEGASQLCRAAEHLADNRFAVYNLFEDRISDLAMGRPTVDRCGYQHVATYVGADYNVYRCCTTSYTKRGLIGSIRSQSLYDLWHNSYRTLADFNAKNCLHCMYHRQNDILAAIVAESPMHGNFV